MAAQLLLLVVPALALMSGSSCNLMNNTDINPHTAGLGDIPGANVSDCCAGCASPQWLAKGCRFFTLSRGRCWFKATADIKIQATGKMSGQVNATFSPSMRAAQLRLYSDCSHPHSRSGPYTDPTVSISCSSMQCSRFTCLACVAGHRSQHQRLHRRSRLMT
jgi:hypothetical protein